MQFNKSHDIRAPQSFVFNHLSDFVAFEDIGLRMGASVERTDDLPEIDIGASWSVIGEFRGRNREIDVTLVEYDRPGRLSLDFSTSGFACNIDMHTIELNRRETRTKYTLTVKPKTLTARLIYQSARLARGSLDRKFKSRIQIFSENIEDRYAESRSA